MIANTYLNAVRAHVDLLVRRGRYDMLVAHDVGTDETRDATLAAYRVYGSRDDADIIMLCAGTNRVGEPLPNRRIYLPLPINLVQIKRAHNKQSLIAGLNDG